MLRIKEHTMWPKEYKDKPEDTSLIKNTVSPGKGIVGCEMHEINGWGLSNHIPKERKMGFFRKIFLGKKKSENQ
jgi:hypothetical protein